MRERLLAAERVKVIEWRDGVLAVLDQRLLPDQEVWLSLDSVAAVVEALGDGIVRGTAAGLAAAYGLMLGLWARATGNPHWGAAVDEDMRLLREARPDDLQLSLALDYLLARLGRLAPTDDPLAALESEAGALQASDREVSLTIAEFGLGQLRRHDDVGHAAFTHGSADALVSGGFGTALGVLRAGWQDGRIDQVYVTEARPGLEGVRLTAWELEQEGVPITLCADTAVGHLMKTERIGWLVLGAERIAANGDVSAQVGTYPLSVLAMHYGLRVMVAAPSACIDLGLEQGDDLAIDMRAPDEVCGPLSGVDVFNPGLDVTPADLIDVLVTERGVIERPDAAKLAELMCRKRLH